MVIRWWGVRRRRRRRKKEIEIEMDSARFYEEKWACIHGVAEYLKIKNNYFFR
jgi:hypothetical protein